MIKKIISIAFSLLLITNMLVPEAGANKSKVKRYYMTATDHINVRQTPSIKGKKLGLISKGSKVYIMAYSYNEWMPVEYKGKKAYVSAKYLKYVNQPNGKWVGNYKHNFSGTGNGLDLLIYKQTSNKIYFGFSYYGRKDSNGNWVYSSKDQFGSASLKNGKAYYSSNGCKITFTYSKIDKQYNTKDNIYTYTNGACGMLEDGSMDQDMGGYAGGYIW
ncbi:SH3 domain-containing protein [Bacillus sp. 31A1R]|uniref:SH3 domain-containing protein n=1 Tax=Robertmurraya mangrovi TaxID=3098077 RepID=A0ABU5IXI6_9BACI|nr:SH3 domain-containing protein [Bacillus sp. 31A1R]MDZ5471884.1 SH3 domain-containing protein [Bacillus sp. 31A1R]